jgi:CHAD domain-containing protein
MADGKWISGLTAETPIVNAARKVLAVRLEVVGDYLPRAVNEPEKDPEYVHQLRVGTRRAGAALKIFALCLPDRVFKTARRQLRKIRRAAGEARDWDVFLDDLRTWGQEQRETYRSGIDCLIGHGLAQRLAAQAHLVEASQANFAAIPFDQLMLDTVHAVRAPQDEAGVQQLIDLARPLLFRLLRDLDVAASRDLTDYANLHQVRIAGKWLRYAMEIFVDCFAPPFKEKVYAAVEQMQDILGRANDSQVASQRLTALRGHLQATCPVEWKRFKPGIEALLRYHQRRLPQERKLFEKWWKAWQATGDETALTALLQQPAAVSV